MRLLLRLGRLPRALRRRPMRPVVNAASKRLAGIDAALVRAGRPSIGSRLAGGAPVLLLTTTGRRSSLRRTTPLVYAREGGGTLVVVAANGAADWDPHWLHNLRAEPHVEVELDGAHLRARAEELAPDARAAGWAEVSSALPSLADAQRAARRALPLVRLHLERG